MNHSYLEHQDSQTPALRLLQRMGYTYLPEGAADEARGGRRAQVIPERILSEKPAEINDFEYREKR